MIVPDNWMDELHRFTQQVPEAYQLLASHYYAAGLQPEDVRPVDIQPLPQSHKQRYSFDAEKQACYYNALSYCLRHRGDCRYVLGYYVNRDIGIPLEHAFVKVGGHYHDPTCQFVDGMGLDQYEDFKIIELTLAEALDCAQWAGDAKLPPTLFEAINWQRRKASPTD